MDPKPRIEIVQAKFKSKHHRFINIIIHNIPANDGSIPLSC